MSITQELASEYEAGLRKMEASNYEEWSSVIPKHKLVIAALQAYTPWQPFETAPKDGTPILCFIPDEHFSSATGVELIWWEPAISGWTQDGDDVKGFYRRPTHWMPVPAAPARS